MLKNKLMQLYLQNLNQKPAELRIEQKADDVVDVYLYSPIGEWYGLSAIDMVREISAIKAKTINLRINSPGGDVFEARAIATAVAMKGNVIAHIDGVCASAATYIATSCRERRMTDGAFFMVHKGWTVAMGNADELRQVSTLLDKVDLSIAGDYAKVTGKPIEELIAMMAAETWMTAQEALDNKFIDSIFNGQAVSNTWNLEAYENVPENLKNGTLNAIASDEPIVYDREKYARRLFSMERF